MSYIEFVVVDLRFDEFGAGGHPYLETPNIDRLVAEGAMFTSDNGFFFGDHIQGRSLVPLLQGNATDWRDSILIEFYTYENPRPWLMDMDYRAVRTDRFKLIHWIQHPGEQELYDLQEDPYEMHNLIDDPKAQDLVDELRVELARLVVQAMGLSESR